jgi:hypothetical protein
MTLLLQADFSKSTQISLDQPPNPSTSLSDAVGPDARAIYMEGSMVARCVQYSRGNDDLVTSLVRLVESGRKSETLEAPGSEQV